MSESECKTVCWMILLALVIAMFTAVLSGTLACAFILCAVALTSIVLVAKKRTARRAVIAIICLWLAASQVVFMVALFPTYEKFKTWNYDAEQALTERNSIVANLGGVPILVEWRTDVADRGWFIWFPPLAHYRDPIIYEWETEATSEGPVTTGHRIN
ncbi:MAG: hypothetical protein NTY30_04900 [Candidatus Berkelbacteria bacterium]|nr:hypothetical protein [Candidatus Berkelbacteria bacterium]